MTLAGAPSLLELFDEPAMLLDESGHIQEPNDELVGVTGVEREGLSGRALPEFLRETQPDETLEAALDAAVESGTGAVCVAFLADDLRREYELSIRRLDDADGVTLAAVAREAADAGLDADILNRISDGFIALDEDWRITGLNRPAAEVLQREMGDGVDDTDLVGRHLWDSIPEAVETTFYEKYHEAMETQEPVSFEEYYPPMDTWFDVRAYPSETGLSVYLYDSTERRRQRDALQARERVLRDMYEIIADRDRTFEEQVEALLVLGREELDAAYGTLSQIRGDDYVFEFVDTDDPDIEAGDVVPVNATNCEVAVSREETLVLGDVARDAPEETDRAGFTEWGIACYIGTPVYVEDEVYGTFCFYDTEPREGQFSDWEVTLVDLMGRWVSSELERQAAAERLKRQNETLEEFASVVSHDLRNPLNVFDARLELAAETGDPEHFEAARGAVERMDQLIDDLLSLARAGDTIEERTAVDLETLLQHCWATVRTDEATLSVETERTVQADESRLRQLLENLLRNAVDHGGESVTITVGDLDRGFYVADDGPGIPPDDREAVLDMGYSTAEEGTGFGLGIVGEIAEAHGWSVSIAESEAGGARIEITGEGA